MDPRLRFFARDERGSNVIEFAIAAPVLLLMLIGIYDMGHTAYLSAMLNGAVQEAARSNALEIADTTKADAYVKGIVTTLAPDAVITSTRSSYYDFADIKRAEQWTDSNKNGTCDNGEIFTDENKNGIWDADIGKSGNGGGNDVVLYKVTVKYTPVFINPFMPNSKNQRTLVASAVRKNQPYQKQDSYGSATGTCS